MGEDRLLKVVSSVTMEMGSRVRWAQDLECSLKIFGWGGVNGCSEWFGNGGSKVCFGEM